MGGQRLKALYFGIMQSSEPAVNCVLTDRRGFLGRLLDLGFGGLKGREGVGCLAK